MNTRLGISLRAAAIVLASGAPAGVAGAAVTYTPVALTARTDAFGPNIGSLAFSSLTGTNFGINNNGEVTFAGSLDGSNSGIWLWQGSGNTLQVKTGDASPAGGSYLNNFVGPIRNTSGQWAFREGSGSSGKIFANLGSGVQLLAKGGDGVSGLPGVTYSNIGTISPYLTGGGHVAFPGSMAGTGIVISGATANNSAVFLSTPAGAVSPVLRQNDETGITDVRVGSITNSSLPLSVNDSGRYLALTNLQGAAVTTGAAAGNDQALLTNRAGSLEVVARRGAPAAGADDGANYRVITSGSNGFNNAGKVAFVSTLRDGSIPAATTTLGAVFTDAWGPLTMVARGGRPMPASTGLGANNWGNSFSDVILTSSGRVAFRDSGITGPGITANVNDSVIITADTAGTMSTVIQSGTQAAGLAAGVLYSTISSGSRMNDLGQIAFITNLTGTGVISGQGGNNSALFATDPNGAVQLICRKGTAFEVAPGDSRLIDTINLQGSAGGEDGRLISFNDNGDLVFGLGFLDGSSGIFVAHVVPTPGAAALAGLGALTLLSRRRRDR